MPGIETVFSSGPAPRWRITARHTNAELRGYLDGDVGDLEALATALKPLGWIIIASPADITYDPFRATPDQYTPERIPDDAYAEHDRSGRKGRRDG